MNKALNTLYKIVELLMIIMLVLMVFSIFLNIIFRYFGSAFSWVDEVSRLTFVWMSFLAVTVAFKKGLHPSFDIILEKLDNKKAKVLLTIINLSILVFLLILLKGSIDYNTQIYFQRTAILGISVSWKYSAIPVTTVIMLLETINKLIMIWKKDEIEIKQSKGGVL